MNLDIGAVITLCLFMVVHLCGTVWWMSKVNATLGFIGTQISDIRRQLSDHELSYVRKESCTERCGMINNQLLAIWKRLDSPHACPNHKDNT